LGVEFALSVLDRGEFAGQNQAQFGPIFSRKPGVAFGLGGLALQRIHLAGVDFVEDSLMRERI